MTKKIYSTHVVVTEHAVDANGTKSEASTLVGDNAYEELHIFADEGKVFRRVSDGEVLTNHISLGTYDRVENYEEIAITQE